EFGNPELGREQLEDANYFLRVFGILTCRGGYLGVTLPGSPECGIE
ncbi:jg23301, partial [Pararge aegeria aegeria]